MNGQFIDEGNNIQVIARPSVTRHAGILAQSDHRRLPADERGLVQPDALLSREAVYADVTTLHWCIIRPINNLGIQQQCRGKKVKVVMQTDSLNAQA